MLLARKNTAMLALRMAIIQGFRGFRCEVVVLLLDAGVRGRLGRVGGMGEDMKAGSVGVGGGN